MVDGCAYYQSPEPHGKQRRVITSIRRRGRCCPGHKERPAIPSGRVALPPKMCSDTLERVLWELRGQGRSLREFDGALLSASFTGACQPEQ